MPTGTITSIRAQANDSQRVNIFIEGEFAIGISLATLARERIAVGSLVDEAAWARIEAAEQADKALHAAARQIDTRPRSVSEIRLFLRRKQYPPEAIDHAVTRLGELGLLDDAAFSRYWLDNRRNFSSRGAIALRSELRQKGVDRDTIAAAMAEEPEEEGAEQARALELARANLRKYAAADRASFQRRLGGFLMRRGYTADTVRPILSRLWAELHDGQADEEPDDEL
jgi:regulatory protein